MTYQVLARKWRPRSFQTLVGQEHVVRALVNALDQDRLHHAFLFTGTRGVGKTTLGRIFAKSLNCEQGMGSTPCEQCSACQEIDAGRFVDLIEVDAASRTKVEDTRDLLENVQYAPTRARYKVYLIDEVHMLSTHSFNALLKTLEEPPPHVKFLLATTDPQKLPVTILSRCLQFNLKRIPSAMIVTHLAYILAQENIEAETPALQEIAKAADGSMRDALSLLDQAIAFGGGSVREREARMMLGSIDRNSVRKLLLALAAQDPAAMLQQVAAIDEQAPDYAHVLGELIGYLQKLALYQMVPTAFADSDEAEFLASASAQFSAQDVQLYYQIGLLGRKDLPLSPDLRSGFEMIVLRMLAFRPAEAAAAGQSAPPLTSARTNPTPTLAEQAPPAQSAAVGVDAARRATSAPPMAAQQAPDTLAQRQAPVPPAKPPAVVAPGAEWTDIVACLGLKGMARELAANCTIVSQNEQQFVLCLDAARAQLHTPNLEARLAQALQKQFGESTQLRIDIGELAAETPARRADRLQADRQQQAQQAIQDDPNVQAMQAQFDAKLQDDSIEPLD